MSLGNVDIGGASVGGKPKMPPVTTVDSSGNPVDDGAYRQAKPVQKAESTDRSKEATSGNPLGAVDPVYPDQHPANDPRNELVGGAIKLTQENEIRKADFYKASRHPLGEGVEPAKHEALAELDEAIAVAERAATYPDAVRNERGRPVVEVLYDTESGYIVSYHDRVIVTGRFIILVDNKSSAAAQKFIPKPGGNIAIKITPEDGATTDYIIKVLGINFSVDHQEFSVFLVVSTEED